MKKNIEKYLILKRSEAELNQLENIKNTKKLIIL